MAVGNIAVTLGVTREFNSMFVDHGLFTGSAADVAQIKTITLPIEKLNLGFHYCRLKETIYYYHSLFTNQKAAFLAAF